jgi:starch synthase (maltosyl-transferring)
MARTRTSVHGQPLADVAGGRGSATGASTSAPTPEETTDVPVSSGPVDDGAGFEAALRARALGATAALPQAAGRVRPVVEHVEPVVDDGRFPAKREQGDELRVEADAFADGHDELVCQLRWRRSGTASWATAPMVPIGNDRWVGSCVLTELGSYQFSVRAMIDRYGTWARDLRIKEAAGKDIALELAVGAAELAALRDRATTRDRSRLSDALRYLAEPAPGGEDDEVRVGFEALTDESVVAAARRCIDPAVAARSATYSVVVERPRARFGAWYELFPRSAGPRPGAHGTFADVEARLDYVASMGFDVLYLPPVHPVGVTNRKGADGAPRARPGEPGSPWAIGGAGGGHMSLHPSLGTIEDFDRLVRRAGEHGLELALDLAFQCSPDHPWVRDHPAWFRHLPDGSIRCAENPPKVYEDIYPLDFDTDDWRALWAELATVVAWWIERGVRIFRVDNPHTKSLRFWDWLIATVRATHPDVIFLSEAFTRPKLMQRLAKGGFSQSYTYFTWRSAKWELEEYLSELHRPPLAEFLRPNLWPNTPDILAMQLQGAGRAAYMSRFVLAATLASSYGVYGPVFELMEGVPRSAGSEEYLHSEKYEIRHWDLGADSLAPFIATVNRARHDNPALQHDRNLRFHHVDNDQVVAYSRRQGANTVVVAVSLDPHHRQSGWLELDLGALGLDTLGIGPGDAFAAQDLLTGERFRWRGGREFLILDPDMPAHLLRLEPL